MRPPFSEEREESINRSDARYASIIEQSQRELLTSALALISKLSQDGDGNIQITNQNYTIAAELQRTWDDELGQSVMGPIFDFFIGSALDLLGLNNSYFREAVTLAAQSFLGISTEAESDIWNIYGYDPETKEVSDGPLSTTFGSSAPATDLISIITQGISAGLSTGDLVDSVSRETMGAEESGGGSLSRHLESSLPDPFVTFDRVAGEVYSVPLELNHAIYQGGLIKTSRDFCIIRNNRPFTRKELEKFGTSEDEYGGYTNKDEGEFQGKWPKEGYNPFRHLGGINCRHALDWISKEFYDLLKAQEEAKSKKPEDGEPGKEFSIIGAAETTSLANSVSKKAKVWGKPLTDDIKSIAKENGVELIGLDHRFKSKQSLERKIQLESVQNDWNAFEVAQNDLTDTVRYTALIDPEKYTDSLRNVVKDLENKGWALLRFENTWDSTDYKGASADFIDKNGNVFELQFHTPDSFYAISGIRDGVKTEGFITSHDYYKLTRELGISKSEKGRLEKLGAALWVDVATPPGISDILPIRYDRPSTIDLIGKLEGFKQHRFSLIQNRNFSLDRPELAAMLNEGRTNQFRLDAVNNQLKVLSDESAIAYQALNDAQWDELSDAETAKRRVETERISGLMDPLLNELEALEKSQLDVELFRSELIKGRPKGTFTAISDGNSQMDVAVKKVDEFLQALVGPNVADGLKQQYNSDRNRGQYDPATKLISVSPGQYAVAVHEMGHALEDFNPGLGRVMSDYLQKRKDDFERGQVVPISMNDLKNTSEYGVGELGWKTSFINPYMAKHYEGGTEILSMMVESMYQDPIAWWDDKETWNFMWSIFNQ